MFSRNLAEENKIASYLTEDESAVCISRVDDGSTFSRKSTFFADVPNWGPFLITLVVIKMLQYHVLLG